MHPRIATLAAVVLIALASTACGGGGGTPPERIAGIALEGSWFGHTVDETKSYVTYRLEIDGTGAITRVEMGGAPRPETGVLTSAGPRTWSLRLSLSGSGHLWTDEAERHAGILFEDGKSAVLEKGATALPSAYAETDVLGHQFAGAAYSVDPTFAIDTVSESAFAAATGGLYIGNIGAMPLQHHPDQVLWPFTRLSAEFGTYRAPYVDGTGAMGILYILLSPDRTFAFVTAVALPPRSHMEDDFFLVWTRQ